MDAFGIEDGPGGAGTGRYAAGLISLPGGFVYGVEALARIEVHGATDRAGRAGTFAASFRDALGSARTSPLPVRLALSTMRAGLGVIEEGLRPRDGLRVELGFDDGATVCALMPAETAALIRHDAEIARGALERAGIAAAPAASRPAPPPPDTAPDEALISIFRYEKRNGRLRRVAAPDKPDG